MSEQRYQAVLAVISEGETVSSVAARFGVHRKTLHGWLARYEAEGLEGLADRSHRPRSCPHQIDADVEAAIATMRTAHPGWGGAGAVGVGDLSGSGPVELDRPLGGGGVVTGSGSGGNAERRWSCGRWTSWAASCSPTGDAPRR